MSTRIALTNLEAYNNGELRFVWLDVPFTDEEFSEAKKAIGNPEEMFVTDIETDIAGYDFAQVSEYPDYDELNSTLADYYSLDEWEQKTVQALMIGESLTLQEAINAKDTAVFYDRQTLKDVAYDLVDEGCFGTIPESIVPYIDYEAIGRDLRHDGYTEISEGDFWGVIEYR